MGLIPLILATLCYCWTAIDLALVQKNFAMALTFACYAAANAGLLASTYRPQFLELLRWVL